MHKATVTWAGDLTTTTTTFEAPFISVQVWSMAPPGPRGGRPATITLHQGRGCAPFDVHLFADVYRVDRTTD